MEKLTQLQIEKGLVYWFKYETPDKNVVELAEYAGEKELSINCTQLDGFPHYPKYIHIDSLEFLREMKQLRSFSLTTARVTSKDYAPILELENLEYLRLPSCKEVKKIYD